MRPRPLPRGWPAATLALLIGAPLAALAQRGTALLEAELARVASAAPAGAVGLGVRHLETGQELYLNGDRAYLMGSTFKVAVALELLTRVDHGTERLARRVPLLARDLFPSGSLLSTRFHDPRDPGADIALIRHLELMLVLSDNTATDVILREIGGTGPVTARLRSLGIREMRVDRTVMDIYADYTGVTLPPPSERGPDVFARLLSARSPAELAAAQRAYHASDKDRATPRAMIQLLATIWGATALSPGSRDLLLSIMRREETGGSRIRGRLPPGVRVANKTGTYGTVVVNDVGIVELPDGAGHVAVAGFTEDSRSTEESKERIIADAARAAYDFFVLVSRAR